MRFILLTCFAFFALTLTAQNWQPLNTTETFHYKRDTAAYIEQSIRVDSAHESATDTTWFLTRIVTPCPTCPYPNYQFNPPTCLQRQVSKGSGGIFVFSDTATYTLYSLAGIGDNWTWSPGVLAVVDTITEQLVFGITDSVKTILLSSGDTVLLSKAHGLLTFPPGTGSAPFRLVGIAGRNLGQLLPGFNGFFDFDPGEVYQYHYSFCNGDISTWNATDDVMKIAVDSVVITGLTQRIYCNLVHKSGIQNTYMGSWLWNYSSSNGYFILADSTTHLANALPNEAISPILRLYNYFEGPVYTYSWDNSAGGYAEYAAAPHYSLRPDGLVTLHKCLVG
jgi:hypothetical protein